MRRKKYSGKNEGKNIYVKKKKNPPQNKTKPTTATTKKEQTQTNNNQPNTNPKTQDSVERGDWRLRRNGASVQKTVWEDGNRREKDLQTEGRAEGRALKMHTTIRKRQICVTGDSSLRNADKPVIRPAPVYRVVCCLSESQPQQLGLKWIWSEGSMCHIAIFLLEWVQGYMLELERQETYFTKKRDGYVFLRTVTVSR